MPVSRLDPAQRCQFSLQYGRLALQFLQLDLGLAERVAGLVDLGLLAGELVVQAAGHARQHITHLQVVGLHQLVRLAKRNLGFVRVGALALGHFQAFLDLFEDAILVHLTPPRYSG